MDPHPENNRKFAELNGICWHEHIKEKEDGFAYRFGCLKCNSLDYNPDYAADPRLVLEMMRNEGKLEEFLFYLSRENLISWIHIDFILDTTGKLRDAALEWMTK